MINVVSVVSSGNGKLYKIIKQITKQKGYKFVRLKTGSLYLEHSFLNK